MQLLAWGLLSAAIQAQAASNPLDVFLEGLDTFSADFEQLLLDSSGKELETTRGSVRLRRPGMFYWLYNEPYTQKIISDGASLWVYEADLEQVTISDVSDAVEDTPALVFSGNYDIDEHYQVAELENDTGHALFELTSRNPEAQYRALRLVFSGNELTGMVLFDSLGQTLLLSFQNVRRNPGLDEELFRFVPTDDMEVIDARQER